MQNTSQKPFILVDGSSYLYRAFHALPPLTTSRGEPTGAIYGVINMLRKLLNDYQPEYIAVIFDTKGKTFRDELYEQYKANRQVMPDDLQAQVEPLHQIIKAMGLPLLLIEGVEADDVIGTLATQATKMGWHSLISTGDKDMAQLVNQHVTLINTMTNTLLDSTGVEQKFGIPPEHIVDYFTLIGDTVDNVPGIPSVGPKTAEKWIKTYGTLNDIVAHANDIKGKVGDQLRSHLTQLPLSQQLITIRTDVPLPFCPSDLKHKIADHDTLVELFKHFEFKHWLSELLEKPSLTDKKSQKKKADYQIITQKNDFIAWLKQLEKADLFSFDTETTSLDYITAELVGVSFAITANEAIYIPFAHDYAGAPQQLEREYVLSQLKPLLEDPKKKKLGHNLKYDMSVLANYDITLRGIAYDTMLESYVLNSAASRHDMDSLALKYLGYRTIHFTDIAGKGSKQLTFNQITLDKAGPYAAEDADITLKLHQALWPKITEHHGLEYTFTEIEMPLIPVLSRIERHGVLVDTQLLRKHSQELAKRIEVLEEKAYQLAEDTFNLNSPKQLQAILFNKFKLPVLQKTPGGQPSTAEDVLQTLAVDYPLPHVILEYRSLSKLKSTYTDRLPEQINSHTGRIHTSYHQAVTATGRLSSSDPNLQNIPARTEEGRRIRKAFIAPPGYKIIAADYSQIELRIMAHISQDEGLLHAFANGWDIHRATAAEVLGIPIEKVTAEQRRGAKAINFGLIYGMSSYGLAQQLGTERQAAQDYIDRYFARYPKVSEYMENTRKKAHQQGFVEGLFGRRLYLPEINSQNIQRKKAAERAAINAPLQGTAADVIKKAMIRLDRWLQESRVDAHMIMQVHDELVFEAAEKCAEQVYEKIKKYMVTAVDLNVPLAVDVKIGKNWDEAHVL